MGRKRDEEEMTMWPVQIGNEEARHEEVVSSMEVGALAKVDHVPYRALRAPVVHSEKVGLGWVLTSWSPRGLRWFKHYRGWTADRGTWYTWCA